MRLLSIQRGYLAEPLSEEEQTKINTYLTICKIKIKIKIKIEIKIKTRMNTRAR